MMKFTPIFVITFALSFILLANMASAAALLKGNSGNPPLVSNTFIDVGQISVINTIISNGISPFTGNWMWISPNALTTTSNSNTITANILVGTLINSVLTVNAYSTTNIIFTFNSVSYYANALGTNQLVGSWTFTANALDHGTNTLPTGQTTNTLTVNPAMTTPSLTMSNTLIDQGQSILFTASFTGGTNTYSYNFLIVNSITNAVIVNQLFSGCTLTTNTFLWTPPANLYTANTFKANVVITDSATTPTTVNSIYNAIGYNAILSSQPSIAATNTLVDQGQNTVISTFETGGTSPYTYNFLIYNSISNIIVANQLGSSNSFSFLSTSLWTSNSPLEANVMLYDSASTNSLANSVSVTITVNSPLSASPTIAATNTLVDQGQNTVISSYETGGTLPYTYNFIVYNSVSQTIVTNMLTTSNSFSFLSDATWTGNSPLYANVIVTDSATANGIANSVNSVTIAVNSLPIVTLTPSNVVLTAGQTETYTISVSGGTAKFNVELYFISASLQQGSNVLIYNTMGSNTISFTVGAPTSTSNYQYDAIVTDGTTAPYVFTSTTNTITVLGSCSGCGNIGGSTGNGGGGGAAGGGSSLPSITVYSSANQTGYTITNLTVGNSETLNFNNDTKTIHITINFITPTNVGITANGQTYNLTIGSTVTLVDPNNYTYYAELSAISYLPIEHTTTLLVYGQPNKPAAATTTIPATTTVSPTAKTTTVLPTPTVSPTSSVPATATGTSSQTSASRNTEYALGGLVIIVIIIIIAAMALSRGRGKKSAPAKSK